MKSLDELLQEAEIAHGHLCAGQILGVRMAMLGLEKLEFTIRRVKTATAGDLRGDRSLRDRRYWRGHGMQVG